MKKATLIPLLILASLTAAHAAPVVQWDFNDITPGDIDTATPSTGVGTISLIGDTATPTSGSGGSGSSDTAGTNLAFQTTDYPGQGVASGTAGIRVDTSTEGVDFPDFGALQITFDLRLSNTSSRWYRVDYTVDGGDNWIEGTPARLGVAANGGDAWYNNNTVVISDLNALDNPDFGFRIVSVFSPDAFTEANSNTDYLANTAYEVARNTTSNYNGGTWRFDMVTVTPLAPAELVQWNFQIGEVAPYTDTTDPHIGTGSIALIGGVTSTFDGGSGSTDPIQPGRSLRTTTYPAQGQNSGTAGIRVDVSTEGIVPPATSALEIKFDVRTSNTASRWYRVDYTVDGGTNWINGTPTRFGIADSVGDSWTNDNTVIISDLDALDNPDFGFRVVSVFSPVAFVQYNGNVSYGANTAYEAARNPSTGNNSAYAGTGNWRFDMVTVTPLESVPNPPTNLEWKPGVGGAGDWTVTGGTNWDGGEWQQGATALFNGTPGVVTLDGEIQTNDILLNSNYTLAAAAGANLSLGGVINTNTSVTATLSAPIKSNSQLRKLGNGTLLLSGEQSNTGTTNIFAGTLRTTINNAHSPNARMVIQPGAVFDLNGTTQTIGGLTGERGTLVQLGTNGTLVIDTIAGRTEFRDDIVGAGNVIIRGNGAQRFRSEKKTYTGFTRIEGGVLEVTSNGEMTDTSAIEVMPNGELFFVGDSSSGSPATFGAPISLMGGRLAFQNIDSTLDPDDEEDVKLYDVDAEVKILEDDSTLNVSGSRSIAIFQRSFGGHITGSKLFRKTGAGVLEIIGNHTHTGGMEIRNGSVLLKASSSIGAGPLLFTQSDNQRSFTLGASAHTVTKLDGDAPSQNDPEAVNTLTLNIGTSGRTFTVNQAVELDEEDNEVTTRFQGDITGAGNFVKSGDGFLALTRWPKTYTGATTINQGVLAVSQPATPTNTSGVTVGNGGQLRLTSGGDSVSYSFGGNISLAGEGRSGAVSESAGQGIQGALRYEPGSSEEGSTATLTNNIVFDAGDGVRVHVSGGSNALALSGNLTGSGSGPIMKSGGGSLQIASANASLSQAWIIENGLLAIASSASTGSGAVTINDGGAITGTGTVGGSLDLLEGGALATATDISGPLLVTGEFTAEEDSIVTVAGTLSEGSVTILTATGGISGVGNLQLVGLEDSGYTGELSVAGDDLILTLTGDESGGITFAQWADGVGADEDVNGNGFPALLEFAFGASAPGQPFPKPVQGTAVMDDIEYLTLTAAIRTNSPTLVVFGETSIDLGIEDEWESDDVDHVTTGNMDVPENTEERIYRTPMNGPARFMRLRAEDETPAP